jgi:uncharacterized OB-fold protein
MTTVAIGQRPLPQPTELTEPFWEATRRRVLVRQRCDDCGANFFPPKVACPHCLSEAWQWVESSGRGAVYSFTVIHRAPGPEFETPYVLAVVDVEEGWTMLTNIVDCAPSDVRFDMPVSVSWQEMGGGMLIPMFSPEPART